MKKIKNGVSYDTEKAERIFGGDPGHEASDAWWAVYLKEDGTWFEVVVDHDGTLLDFYPLEPEAVRIRLERTANHLVEKYFGPMLETSHIRFSRRTRIAAIEFLEERIKEHSKVTRLLLKLGEEINTACEAGVLADRWNHLIKFLDRDPLRRLADGRLLADALVEEAASRVTDGLQSVAKPVFTRSVQADGFDISDGTIIRQLPKELDLVEAEDEISRLLRKHGFATLKGHLEQAMAAHGRGDWASANSQLRAFYEGLFDEIALEIDPTSASLASSENRRQRLSQLSFLKTDLNEWGSDGKNFVNGLFRRLHPAGSHPGLSDQDDSTFRRHVVLITARLMLSRLDAWP